MSIPQKHTAALIHKTGGLDEIKVEQVDVPQIKAEDVLVRNSFAGVNFIESYFISGLYKAPSFPYVLGREAAGQVVAVGDNVKNFAVGDKVAYLSASAAAQYTAVPSTGNIVKLVEGVSEKIAAASIVQALTAFSLTKEAYPIQKGDYVLVHAAAGGTGAIIVQFAKLFGATVIGTTSTPEKAEVAKAAGADYVINYREEDTAKRVEEITGGKGVQAVYDGVGKDTWETSLKAVARKGTIASFGNASGAVPPVSLLSLSPKNVKVVRPTLFNYIATPEEWQHYSSTLVEYIQAGKIKIDVSKVYPLSELAQALTDLTSGKTTGKLLVEIE